MLPFVGLTLLFTLLLVGFALGLTWIAYRRTWSGPQKWLEATRHQHRLALLVGRWIWFKWIHLDCQYWILHLDFSAGPIELRGKPPAGSYWSFTYNTWTETNPAINSNSVILDDDGRYRILYSHHEQLGNWIRVNASARKGVIYFRIYEARGNFPSELPEVWQNGKLIARKALS